MSSVAAPTFRDLVHERAGVALREYRQLVGQAASGWTLSEAEHYRAAEILESFGLPAWAFGRDLVAVRTWWATESESRRRELLVVHPHLFADPLQWVELRREDEARRRELLEQIREAATWCP